MKPRSGLCAAALVAALLAGCGRQDGAADGGGGTAPVAAPGADVVLITIDTLRADAPGFAGNAAAATPVLDRLAAAGRVFTDAHAHNVVTLPSHANILTGRHPYEHGVRDNAGFVLPASVPTLATLLGEAGYATGAFVAAYPLDAGYGLGRGFDVYDDRFPRGSRPDEYVMPERRGDQVVAPAKRWWDAHRGKRRFLWVHLYDPHAPYAPPEPFASRFRDQPYHGEVAATDAFLAPLLEPLLAGGEPPALVVVTADHGEALGEHGELTHGLFAYEATLAVPLVIWGPGVPAARDDRPARHVDILPTVLAAVGQPVPQGLPGRSLLAAPDTQAVTYFEALTTNLNRGWAPLRGVLAGGRKMIELPLPELYHLPSDPGEQRNLVASERGAVRELLRLLPAGSAWPPPREALDAEQEAQLRSLGYAAGSPKARASYGPEDDPKNLVALDTKLQEMLALYAQGRYAATVALAREVLAERPGMEDAAERLALALRQLERHDEAIAELRRVYDRGEPSESLRRQLAQALSEVGRGAEAVEVLRPVAESRDAATINAYGVALSEAGAQDEARAVLRRSLELHPSDPRPHENLGMVALRSGRPDEARAHLERALALNEALPNAWNTLGVARYQQGDPAAAIAAWQRSVALDPRRYDALFNLGLVAAQAGQPRVAREALERFVATAPPQRYAADLAKARAVLARLPS